MKLKPQILTLKRPVPDKVLEALLVPSVDSFSLINMRTVTASNGMCVLQVPSVDSISFINMSTAVSPADAAAARLAQTSVALRDFAQQQQQLASAAPSAARALPPSSAPVASSAADSSGLARELLDLCAAKGGHVVTEAELAALPVYVQLDDVASDFVEIRVVLNTAPLRCGVWGLCAG